jgi:hypothetical protein
MDKREAKRLMEVLGKTAVEGYSVEVGRATLGLTGELTVKLILKPTTGEAAADAEKRARELWETMEKYRGGDPIPFRAKFLSRNGTAHTTQEHTRTGKVITTTADGRKWTWQRDAIQGALGLNAAPRRLAVTR